MKRRATVFCLVLALPGLAALFWVGGQLAAPWPARIGPPPPEIGCSDVEIPSASGSLLHGWFCPSTASRGSVLLLPGVRANRLSMLGRARFLHRAGFSVLLIDFQATGESPGEHITFGWLESRDARAAIDFLKKTRPGTVAVLGSSLGGAASVLADPPLPIDALILEAVYPTIERATENRLALRFGPTAGRLAAPLLLVQLPFRLGVGADALRPVDRIGDLQVPIFILSGSEDRHTTREDTLHLYSRVRAPKSLWLVPGAAHVDLHRFAGAEYERRVLGFLSGIAPR